MDPFPNCKTASQCYYTHATFVLHVHLALSSIPSSVHLLLIAWESKTGQMVELSIA